ncbi:MAG: WYL domain-containing protein [Clostridia bacterium]|nr:WYL domain-containing protein [Clostridia bacterium]
MNSYVAMGIITHLLIYKKASAKDLSEKFEVSKKTIYRYIDMLSSSGVPVFCSQGRSGGISLDENFTLDNNSLTFSELSRLNSLVSSSELGNIDITSKTLKDKLNMALNNSKKLQNQNQNYGEIYIDNLPWGVTNISSEKILNLADCCSSFSSILLEYQNREGEISSRIVNPYCLVLKDGIWYLYAYCTLKDEFRLFKCSRITSFSKTGKHFEHKNINLNTKPWLSGGFSEVDVSLSISPSVLPDFYDWLGSNFKLYTDNGDFIIKFRATCNSGLISRLMAFGDKVKVLSPTNVASSLADCCAKISNLYAIKA